MERSEIKEHIKKLLDKDRGIRIKAAHAIGLAGPDAKEAVPALVEALRDKSLTVRWRSAQALGRLGPSAREAVPALTEALKDDSSRVRWHVIMALRLTGCNDWAAAEALVEALGREDRRVHWRAAEVMGRMGPGSRIARAALIDALGLGPRRRFGKIVSINVPNYDDLKLRLRATLALTKVGTPSETVVPAFVEALRDDRLDDIIAESKWYEGGTPARGRRIGRPLPPPPPPYFTISVSPSSYQLSQGDSAEFMITVTSHNGFSRPVRLAVGRFPAGCMLSFSPTRVTPLVGGSRASNLVVTASLATVRGIYEFFVMGIWTEILDATKIKLVVT